ncbi:ATPase assembly factor ATP10 [Mycena floridula]|nr:ATPase assembly factor ATP10 [Mycena floridula]
MLPRNVQGFLKRTPCWQVQHRNLFGVRTVDEDGNPLVVPPLTKPLGVRERPTIFEKSFKEKAASYLDMDTVMKDRKHLYGSCLLELAQVNKGYYHDLKLTMRHGGKTWIAPKVLIREDKALYLPDLHGKSLLGETKHTTTMCFGRITLLSILGTKISEIHCKGFTDPTHARYKSHPSYQHVQINVQENVLKSMLVNLFVNSMRSTVPTDLHATFLVSNQNLEYIREPMGCTNSKVGYVYLIDENLKIRWAGGADALAEETQSLETCTGILLKRLDQGNKK